VDLLYKQAVQEIRNRSVQWRLDCLHAEISCGITKVSSYRMRNCLCGKRIQCIYNVNVNVGSYAIYGPPSAVDLTSAQLSRKDESLML